MKKITLLMFALAVGLSALVNAQNTIIVQAPDGTNPRIFSSIDDAVTNANPNDYLYIGKGTYNITAIPCRAVWAATVRLF